MDIDKYLIYDENKYAIGIFDVILKEVKSLYQYKILARDKVKNKLDIVKEKSKQYENVVDSMAISRIISPDKNYFNEGWEEIEYISSSLKYYEIEVEYIEKVIGQIEDIIDILEENTRDMEKEIGEDFSIDEELSRLNRLRYIKSLLGAQIAIENTIIENINMELKRINTFGTYNLDNIINFIKLDSNTRITDLLLNDWIQISDINIDQGIINRINIFNNIFSDYILNHEITDTLDAIDVVRENLKIISDYLDEDTEKEEEDLLRLKEKYND